MLANLISDHFEAIGRSSIELEQTVRKTIVLLEGAAAAVQVQDDTTWIRTALGIAKERLALR